MYSFLTQLSSEEAKAVHKAHCKELLNPRKSMKMMEPRKMESFQYPPAEDADAEPSDDEPNKEEDDEEEEEEEPAEEEPEELEEDEDDEPKKKPFQPEPKKKKEMEKFVDELARKEACDSASIHSVATTVEAREKPKQDEKKPKKRVKGEDPGPQYNPGSNLCNFCFRQPCVMDGPTYDLLAIKAEGMVRTGDWTPKEIRFHLYCDITIGSCFPTMKNSSSVNGIPIGEEFLRFWNPILAF